MRFRNYIAEHYKKSKEILPGLGVRQEALRIIIIYILGFSLDIEAPAIKVQNDYVNLITDDIIYEKDQFMVVSQLEC